MSTSSGKDLERLTAMVFKGLFDADGRDVKISQPLVFSNNHNGVISTYEVDVFYEFHQAGIRHRVAVECKDWSKPVSKGQILEFAQKIKCIGWDVIGVFVSTSGYQKGAEADAAIHGITTYTPESLPSFYDLLKIKFQRFFIPTKETKAEPFYTLLNDSLEFACFPFEERPTLPFFIQKSTAEKLLADSPEWRKNGFHVLGLSRYHLVGYMAFLEKSNMVDLHLGLITSSLLGERKGYMRQVTTYSISEFRSEFMQS
ncbi:restriction endonuclease [Pseudomonas stutzeri]|nr:restriction endonuclease [Stutzerimonas stutzeri]